MHDPGKGFEMLFYLEMAFLTAHPNIARTQIFGG
jgi:hypothetical protein